MKTVKFLVSAIALSVMCVACSSNPYAKAVEDMKDAVDSKDKDAIAEVTFDYALLMNEQQVLGIDEALNESMNLLTLEQKQEINDYIKEEMSDEYKSVAEAYLDAVKDYAEALVECSKDPKNDDKLEELVKLDDEVKYLKNRLANANSYLSAEVKEIINQADTVKDLVEKYFFGSALKEAIKKAGL